MCLVPSSRSTSLPRMVSSSFQRRDPQDCMVAHQCGFDGEITQSVRCNASQVWSKMASSCVWEWDPDRDDCNGSPQVPIPSEYNLVPCFISSAASVQSGLSRLQISPPRFMSSDWIQSHLVSVYLTHLTSPPVTSPYLTSLSLTGDLTLPYPLSPHLIVAVCTSAHLAVDFTSPNLAVPRSISPHLTVPHLIVSLLVVLRSVFHCTSQPTLSCCPSPHTLPYLTSSHFTSLFCASPDRISSFLTVLHLTSPYLNSSHNTSSRLTIPHLTSPYLAPSHSTRLDSPYLTSSHFGVPHPTVHPTSLYLTSPRPTVPHLTSLHLT